MAGELERDMKFIVTVGALLERARDNLIKEGPLLLDGKPKKLRWRRYPPVSQEVKQCSQIQEDYKMGLSASEKAKVLRAVNMVPRMQKQIDELEDDIADLQRLAGRKKKSELKDGK